MSFPRSLLPGLVLVSVCFAGPTWAQTPPAETEQAEEDEVEPIERLKTWPKVDKEAVKNDVERLRKVRTEEMGEQARDALIEAGAGVVPYLLPKLGREKDEDTVERILLVLDTVTGAPHTRLLAESFGDRSVAVRIWSLTRVAAFPDAELRKQAELAYETAKNRKERDRDEKEVYAAALCAASTGSLVGFEEIFKEAEKRWGDSGQAIYTALTATRGPEATRRVAPLLDEKTRQRKTAGLRLLSACGDKETAVHLVAPFLDNSDNALRVAAINALRGIVDGDPPLDKLPVFEAIERANAWKRRL